MSRADVTSSAVWQSGPVGQQDFEDLVLELHKIQARAFSTPYPLHRVQRCRNCSIPALP